MTAPRTGWRQWLALVAAVLFLVQSLAGGAAATQATLQLDAFGNPLCITSGDHKGVPASDHGKLPGCCMLGCVAASVTFGVPPDGASIEINLSANLPAPPLPLPPTVVQANEHDPGSPRAPPVRA